MENRYLEEAEKAQKIVLEISEGSSPELTTYIESEANKIEILVERLNDGERSTLFRDGYSNFNPTENIDHFRLTLTKKTGIKRRKMIIRVVASLSAAVIVFSLFLFNQPTQEIITSNTSNTNNNVVENRVSKNILVPILITQDSVIEIVGGGSKIIAAEYLNDKTTVTAEKLKNSMQRLIIPHGGTYTVILHDGTEVMLNAGSELSYPSIFNMTGSREVTLKGEAFFNVKKSKQQFIVNTHNGTQVRVYGTQFNLNAKNPDKVITILIEGSVGFKSADTKEIKIKPNQMIVWNSADNSNEVADINPNEYLGWRIGLFDYNNGNFNTIMNEIASWYGVEFNYDRKQFDYYNLSISIDRSVEIDDLLVILEDIAKIENIKFIKGSGGEYSIVK